MQECAGRGAGELEGPSPGSVRGGERVEIVDVLRGIAILGMLVANLEYFRTPEVWVGYGAARSVPERSYLFLDAFLADGKFITALSFLLGLGLALQARRSGGSERGAAFFLRRLLALAGIGATHALLVWSGDILLLYATLGVPFLLFVRRRPGTLVALSCSILGVWTLVALILSFTLVGGTEPTAPSFALEGLARSAETTYTSGSLLEMTAQRVREYLANLPPALLTSCPQIFSMMLLGAAAANAGWVEDRVGLGRRSRRAALLGLAVGIPLNLFYALPVGIGDGPYYLHLAAWLAGAPIMALGWMGLVVSLHDRLGPANQRLAAVGRMAVTNYLAQSLIMTTVFYWFGLYGNVPIEFAVGLMVGVWSLQILWSKPWLSRFGHGPVEWLWRRLSYGHAYRKTPR